LADKIGSNLFSSTPRTRFTGHIGANAHPMIERRFELAGIIARTDPMQRTIRILMIICGALSGLTAQAQTPLQVPDLPPVPMPPPAPYTAPSTPIPSTPMQMPVIYGARPYAGPMLPPTVVLAVPPAPYPIGRIPQPAPPPPPKKTGVFHWVYDKTFGPVHQREPDGVPFPVGCSNIWTEYKYFWGSATQFFGSADATYGHWHKTIVPPPYRIPYPMLP
jgi:hypothetical protein